MISYMLLIAGLAILVIGGDVLIRGAVALAERLSIPPLIIGLTIVSLGTSAPELFISVQAAIEGSGALAVGNVVGSNIANILLVLGLPAIFVVNPVSDKGIGRNILVMIGFTILFMGMMAKGILYWYDGAVLVLLLGAFLYEQYRTANKSKNSTSPDYHDDVPELPKALWVSVLFLVVGIALLPLGAALTVHSAQDIALSWGISEEVIGLTVVAIGTSLPELAASMMAVIKGKSSVAIGNVVGSNVFNIAAIMGITALIVPVDVGSHIIGVDMWVMLAVTVGLGLLAHYRDTIGTKTGLAMVSAYVVYVTVALLN